MGCAVAAVDLGTEETRLRAQVLGQSNLEEGNSADDESLILEVSCGERVTHRK